MTFRRTISVAAFTLIELLVVISIVAILAILIFPAAQSSLRKSDSSRCVSNLRQIGVGLMAFAADNDGVFPIAGGTVARGGVDGGTQKPGWAEQLIPYVGDDWHVFLCRSASKTAGCNKEMSYFLGTRAAYLEAGTFAAVRLSKITHPAHFILAGDNAFSGFEEADIDKDDYSIACPFAGKRPHSGKSNVLFADGSVRGYGEFMSSEMQCSYDDPSVLY